MKKIIILLLMVCVMPSVVFAHGDGYTDCERDAIYQRDNLGVPKTGLFLRDRACMTDSEIMKVLPIEEQVQIIAYTDGWMKVRDNTGAVGWVGATLMKELTPTSVNNKLSAEHYTLGINKGVNMDERRAMLKRVKGYILLQVESHGEAWYVEPITERRHYMADGLAAYNMMRNFGLGINNANLEKLKTGDSNLINRLKGRIVLQVEARGEAFYIHPKNGSIHYLENGEEAYRIMREISLGISNVDLEKISE